MRRLLPVFALLLLAPLASASHPEPHPTEQCLVTLTLWTGAAGCSGLVQAGANYDACPRLDGLACADGLEVQCFLYPSMHPVPAPCRQNLLPTTQ